MFELTKLSQEDLSQQFNGDQWPVFNQVELLPGVVQIHWAGELGKLLFNIEGFAALKNVKFNSMVLPNSQIILNLKYTSDKQTLRFDYTSDSDKYSSGALVFNTEKQAS